MQLSQDISWCSAERTLSLIHISQGRCLGFDGRTVSAKEAAELEKMLDENGVSLSVDHDLAGDRCV